jgi:hypothetical protein
MSRERQMEDCANPDLLVAIPAYLRIMGNELKHNNFVMLAESESEITTLRLDNVRLKKQLTYAVECGTKASKRFAQLEAEIRELKADNHRCDNES